MLQSAQIQARQSEIRQSLAELSTKPQPTADETRSMDDLTREYGTNESRFRAALVGEDEQRQQAGKELETRSADDFAKLVDKFELRQVALHLDEGAKLEGATAEVVQELRSRGGYRGVPVPFAALEQRAEAATVAANLPSATAIRPTIERLFPQSVAGAMGASMVNIATGSSEWPITTDGAVVGWASTEGGNVADSVAYKTSSRSVAPDHTLGVQMKITRKAVKSSAGIEAAIRRDMQGAIQKELDRVVFLGSGASGQPNGIITGADDYGINVNATAAAASWALFRAEIIEFLKSNTANGPGSVRMLMRPEVWAYMDSQAFLSNTAGITEFAALQSRVHAVVQSSNALAAPVTDASSVLLTTTAGAAPIFVATWGAIDLIRDPYSDAQAGGLRLTALVTLDVTAGRAAQSRVLTAVQSA